MRNNAYWANRMRILEESLLDTGYDYVKNLERQYDIAIKAIEEQTATWYQRFAKNNDMTLAEARKLLTAGELKEFKWTVEEYIKHGQQNAVSQAWMKQLENASARVHISRLDSLKLQLQQQAETLYGNQLDSFDELIRHTYSEGYYRTAFEIQQGFGVGWSLHGLTDDAIRKVLSRPWTLDAQTFSDRIWSNKQGLVNSVNTQLTQMIMRGAAPDRAIKAISERFRVSKSQAGRLVMTESAAFANIARKDCFNDLGVEKFIVIETLDHETCGLCGQLDGKVFPMSEYAVGVTAPPFHPWCRGTTAPYFADLEGVGDRFARDAEGKTYAVPKDMSYKEWRKKSVVSTEVGQKPFTEGKKDDIIIVETPEAARDALIKHAGFSDVESSFSTIDKDLQVENANQLLALESKFGAIHKSTGTICAVSGGKGTEAYVSSRLTNPGIQNMSLCPNYFKDKAEHIKTLLAQKAQGWSMPFRDSYATVYNVTHEYGHMLQNILTRDRMLAKGWTADNAGAFIAAGKRNRKAMFKWYYDVEKEVGKECFDEIVSIAKDHNPDFSLRDNISKYGQTSYFEFFAEVFANSQLGEANELGKAMQIWLERKGLILK